MWFDLHLQILNTPAFQKTHKEAAYLPKENVTASQIFLMFS